MMPFINGPQRACSAPASVGSASMLINVMGPQPGRPLHGVSWKSPVMSSLGLPTTAAYGSLVAKARRALQQNEVAWKSSPAETPSVLPARNMRASADGGPLVKKDPSLRLVGVSMDKALHTKLATKLDFLRLSRGTTVL